MRVQLHNIKAHPTLTDISDSSQLLRDFRDSMSSSELLNCADAAALLIEDFNSCGIAYLDVTSSCGAVSVTMKSCATGYYRLLKTTKNCFFVTIFLVLAMKSDTTLGQATTESSSAVHWETVTVT